MYRNQDNWRQIKSIAQRRDVGPFTLPTSDNRGWVRQECAMTQTSPSIESNALSPFKMASSPTNCADDPDLLEVLSQCEDTNAEYDFNEDDEQRADRHLDKDRMDTLSVDTKNGSAERDEDSEVVMLRNGDVVVLRHDYSDKSLSSLKTTKSEWDSVSMANHHDSYRSSNGSILQMPLRRPFGLQLTHEPFHNIMELPSPSSASLHSGHGNTLMQELTTKSNSAPILLKKERKRDDFVVQPIVRIFIIYQSVEFVLSRIYDATRTRLDRRFSSHKSFCFHFPFIFYCFLFIIFCATEMTRIMGN